MKLSEVARPYNIDASQIARDVKTKTWLDFYKITNYVIRPDGIVDVDGNVEFFGQEKDLRAEFPIKFGRVRGDFYCSFTSLKSLVGCPYDVGGCFFCRDLKIPSLVGAPRTISQDFSCSGTSITTIEGMPRVVGGNCHMNAENLISLSGIDKQVDHIHFFAGHSRMTHLLGLVLIKGLTGVDIDNGRISIILNTYVGTGDILSCQDELLDAGFKEQAKL